MQSRAQQVIFHEAYGQDRTYQKDAILQMQSLSTPVITAALMTLVDEGRVRLDDDVTKYLPYFSNFRVYRSGTTESTLETVPLGIPITIRHLLTHTWGFPAQRFMESSSPEIRMVPPTARRRGQSKIA